MELNRKEGGEGGKGCHRGGNREERGKELSYMVITSLFVWLFPALLRTNFISVIFLKIL